MLQQGDYVVFKVKALNQVGWSDVSNVNTVVALMEDVPRKPLLPPSRNDLLTSDLLLQVDWQALSSPEDGGALVLSYHLQYDDASGGSSWVDLTGLASDEIVFAFGVTSSIQAGIIYSFRYRARNAHGWGPFSDTLKLISARRTDTPAPVVTSNEGTNVRISWAIPAYDGGSRLLGYRITIKTALGEFIESAACNG